MYYNSAAGGSPGNLTFNIDTTGANTVYPYQWQIVPTTIQFPSTSVTWGAHVAFSREELKNLIKEALIELIKETGVEK